MTFIWPRMLLTLLLVPILIWGYVWLFKKHQRMAAELGPMSLLQNSSGDRLGNQRHTSPLIFLIGLTFLLFGLARPEMFVDLPRVEGTVILAFDISNSMAANDLKPTRLEVAKEAARTFVEKQPSSIQIGVVAFSNGGLVVQPPTDDQATVLATIDRLNPQGATSLGQGIFSSLSAIAGEAIQIDPTSLDAQTPSLDIGHFPSAVILLLTDGENTSSPDPFEIAQLAADAGVRIYPIGIGDPEGAILEIEGFNIFTQLNEPALREIANITNGLYYHAENEEALQEIYKNVDLRLTISGETMETTAIFAGISLLFFLLGAALSLHWYGRMPL